jgi:hypothetical protein
LLEGADFLPGMRSTGGTNNYIPGTAEENKKNVDDFGLDFAQFKDLQAQ